MTDNLFSFLDDDACHIEGVKSDTYPEGRTYSIPSPNAVIGMRLMALGDITRRLNAGLKVSKADMAKLKLDDDEERDLQEQVMGPVLDEMRADGVSHVRISRSFQYAYIYFSMGADTAAKAAERGLLSGGKVHAPLLNREQRRGSSSKKKNKGQ